MEFQSSPNLIETLNELGLEINWTLIKIGYEGQPFLPKQLTAHDISQYAECLAKDMEYGYEHIALLIVPENEESFCETLNTLAKGESVEISTQQRKIRLFTVQKALESLPVDYCDGLFELNSLWVSLGIPDDCPHVFQGRNNTYSPSEYYTQIVYDLLLERNKQWIKCEIDIIKRQENSKAEE